MRAAENLAAHRFDAPVVQGGVAFGAVAPVVQAVLVHLAHADGNVNQRVDVAAAGFEHEDAVGARRAEPVGEHAAR